VHEYMYRESGRKGADKRQQFAALFEDAHRPEIRLRCCFGGLDLVQP